MKKQILKSALIAMAGVGLLAGSAMATPILPGSETPLATILSNEGYTINVATDQVADDRYWSISESKSGAWASLLIEIAGNGPQNNFGIFDASGNQKSLLPGAASEGDKVAITMGLPGYMSATFKDWNGTAFVDYDLGNFQMSSVFGFYISGPGGTYYSDYSKNITDGQADHMVAYAGTKIPSGIPGITPSPGNGLTIGHYILAFEDLASPGWDQDYNDMVILVESVNPSPVPEPATMLLFGTGLAGLAAVARRRKTQA